MTPTATLTDYEGIIAIVHRERRRKRQPNQKSMRSKEEVDPAVLRRCDREAETTIQFTEFHYRVSLGIRVYEWLYE